MGTYKVFNGTDWVNICDCQVHIRNASNNWQLLDPANCVTKYWTGTEWCEVTCTPVDPCPDCVSGNITIGTQVWAQCNLDVTTYRNGDPIPQVTDPTAWANLTTGAWCWYANDSANGPVYGKLYNWHAVNDTLHGGLAPVGYHVPTDAEFTTLIEVGLCHWNSPNTDATNTSGFTGLPGGIRSEIGNYASIGYRGTWWSSTEGSTSTAWGRDLSTPDGNSDRYSNGKTAGLSVRVIKD